MLARCFFTLTVWLVAVSQAGIAAADAGRAGRLLVHIPGIGGERWWDDRFVEALRQGGLDAETVVCNWTGGAEPVKVLRAGERNRQRASEIARLIVERHRADPARRLYITAHSGGTAVAVWALEELPEDVMVEAVVLMAPALSPGYDLSRALRRVRTRMYVFSSPHDRLLLDWGTRLVCTMDGQQCRAAGLYGFVMPPGADRRQYAKLDPQPYRREWLLRYGNFGGHLCTLRPQFARRYIAPLMLSGRLPQPPATQATGRHAVSGMTGDRNG